MGDRLATIDMGRKVGAAVPLSGQLGPHLTQCRLGRGLPSYQVASWSVEPFGTTDVGENWGGLCTYFLVGELGPHLTQCGLGRGAYLHIKWHLDPSNRFATVHQRHTDTVRQDRQTTIR